VDRWAEAFQGEIIEPNGPGDRPWGMYEFAISDPDATLVRIGWPTRLRGRREAGPIRPGRAIQDRAARRRSRSAL
ncbi:MAG TPA: hypothetical protein VFW13_08045, partial [Phenylobacterium sp.]|nr:hypothetical protein [Phenylobacterium sp.]